MYRKIRIETVGENTSMQNTPPNTDRWRARAEWARSVPHSVEQFDHTQDHFAEAV